MATLTFGMGRVGPLHKGAWSSTVQYAELDTVYYTDGTLYINAYNGLTPIGTLPTNTTYWMVYIPGVSTVAPVFLDLVQYMNTTNVTPQIAARNFLSKNSSGLVVVHFNITLLVLTGGTVIATLPVGYRPYNFIYNNTQTQLFGINPTGGLYISGTATLANQSDTMVFQAAS